MVGYDGIDRCCKTCKNNSSKNKKSCLCVGEFYGKRKKDINKQRECWDVSMEYNSQLIDNDVITYDGFIKAYLPSKYHVMSLTADLIEKGIHKLEKS